MRTRPQRYVIRTLPVLLFFVPSHLVTLISAVIILQFLVFTPFTRVPAILTENFVRFAQIFPADGGLILLTPNCFFFSHLYLAS